MIQLIGVMNRRTGVRDGGLLRMFNWRIWHDEATNAPRRCPACHAEIHLPRNEPGFPDLVLVRGETLWLVELKADRGKLSAAQREWYDALKAVTQVHTDIWKPRDLPAIVETMR
jgi:hypothetical protein